MKVLSEMMHILLIFAFFQVFSDGEQQTSSSGSSKLFATSENGNWILVLSGF